MSNTNTITKKMLVCGAGGFIGHHLVKNLKQQGHYVVGTDLKYPEYQNTDADEFYIQDLRQASGVNQLLSHGFDTVYQLAADMGGAGYIFTGDNDADIMHNSALINLNILEAMVKNKIKNVFYTSSACIYPAHNQTNPGSPLLSEDSAYPANPDSEYGWEKLFSERLYVAWGRNHDLRVRIARLHNIFGPMCSWNNGREKAPAAICRKVAESTGEVEIWGPGTQTRSFLYINECIEGIHRIQKSDYRYPLNLGSERMISINDLCRIIAQIANKQIIIRNTSGPVGVMGRNSHNQLIQQEIGWAPKDNLEQGLTETYRWIEQYLKKEQQ